MHPGKLSPTALGQIIAVFFIEASSSAAFAVFFSGLSLYLTKNLLISDEGATNITGLFLSMNYFLPLIGGILANRIISYKGLYLSGTVASVIGCLLLATGQYLYLALSLFLMSSLVTHVCLNMFVTQLFTEDQQKERRIAFLWNYVGMNLGFMIGYLMMGFSSIFNHYIYLFIAISLLLFVSLLLTFIFIKEPKLKNKIELPIVQQIVWCNAVIALLVICMTLLFHHHSQVHSYMTICSILLVCTIFHYALLRSDKNERIKLFRFIGFSTIAIGYWTIYMLTPIAIMQFIEHNVERHVFGITLAPHWLVNIDSIVILSCVPLLTFIARKTGKDKLFTMSTSSYFSYGFLFTLAGFLALSLGLFYTDTNTKIPLWFMLSYLIFLTVGEIFVSPVGNAIVGDLIKEPLRGVMTGVWSMNIGIGGLIASKIANSFILPYIDKNGVTIENSLHLQHFVSMTSCLLLVFMALSLVISRINVKTIKILNSVE